MQPHHSLPKPAPYISSGTGTYTQHTTFVSLCNIGSTHIHNFQVTTTRPLNNSLYGSDLHHKHKIFYCDPCEIKSIYRSCEIKSIYRSWTPQVNETVQFSRFTQHWVCAVLIWIFSGPKTNKTVSTPLVFAPHGMHSGQHMQSHNMYRKLYLQNIF